MLMARVVNTDTTVGRQAAIQRVWLVGLLLAGALLAGNLTRGVVAEMGGLQQIREAGLFSAASGGVSRVFSLPGGKTPTPHVTREWVLLGLHLVGLVVLSQLIWLPLSVLRGRAEERRVLRELRQLPDDYWVLTDLLVPGAQAPSQVDHVVVSRHGLWCLETKEYVGRVVGKEHDYEWLYLKGAHSEPRRGKKFFNPVRQNTTNCAHLSDHLMRERLDASVRSMIVFIAAEPETMTMTPVERLGSFVQAIVRLDGEQLTAGEQLMDHQKVAQIVGTLSELLATKPRRGTKAATADPAIAAAREPNSA
jgi:hypothetical protein